MTGSPRRFLRCNACCAVLAVALGGRLQAAEFSAGPSATCMLATLTEALAAAAANGDEPDSICVDYQFVTGPFVVDLDATGDLEITGCAQCAGSQEAALSFLGGRGLIVTADGPTRRHLTLRGIGLYNTGQNPTAGRKLDVSGYVSVTADSLSISAGDEIEGGALHVDGADAELVFTDASIVNEWRTRTRWVGGDGGLVLVDGATVRFTGASFFRGRAAGHGGAIACRGGGTVILEDSLIEENFSGAGGAGIWAENCSLTLSGLTALVRNECWDEQYVPCAGGGLLASGGSQVSLSGPPRLFPRYPTYRGMTLGNRATNGAALLAVGAGTIVEARNVTLVGDEASIDGLVTAESGAALAIFRSTLLWGDAPGSSVSANGAGSSVLLESVRFWRGGGTALMGVAEGAGFTAAHITADGNPSAVPNIKAEGQGSTFELYSSLMLDGRVFGPLGAGAEVAADCVIAIDLTGLPPPPRPGSYFAVASSVDVLQWPDRRADLRVDSPAIDRCDASFYQPLDGDLDAEARPFDQPPAGTSHFGIYDVGADESRGLFFGDFEEGDCAEWSLDEGCP